MKTNTTVKCTRRILELILADVHTLGYYALDAECRAICDAYDKGTLIVEDSK